MLSTTPPTKPVARALCPGHGRASRSPRSPSNGLRLRSQFEHSSATQSHSFRLRQDFGHGGCALRPNLFIPARFFGGKRFDRTSRWNESWLVNRNERDSARVCVELRHSLRDLHLPAALGHCTWDSSARAAAVLAYRSWRDLAPTMPHKVAYLRPGRAMPTASVRLLPARYPYLDEMFHKETWCEITTIMRGPRFDSDHEPAAPLLTERKTVSNSRPAR